MPEGCEPTALIDENVNLDVIDHACAEVLETMFFTEAVPDECEHAWCASALTARIHFDGTHSGEFLLSVSLDAARPIAAGFLGLADDESTERDCGQVILELANILCGAVLSKRWPESRLSLATPELSTDDHSPHCGVHRCFTLPEGLLALTICGAKREE